MEKLFKNVKLSSTPDLLFANAGDLIIKLQPPYSENGTSLMISPNVTLYEKGKETPNVSIGPIIKSNHSKDTRIMRFDFDKNNTQKIKVEGKNYEIRLMSINKDNPLSFEFLVKGI